MQKKKTGETEELYGELGKAFNFTQGDLEANRAGFMSWRQKQAQWTDLRVGAKAFLGIWIFFFGGAAFLQIIIPDAEADARAFWIIVAIAAFLGVFFLYAIFVTVWDVKLGRVQKIVSPIHFEEHYEYKIGTVYTLVAGEHKFSLPQEAKFSLWKPSLAYRIYFLPKSNRILSLEKDSDKEE